jgi:hypothetical protein
MPWYLLLVPVLSAASFISSNTQFWEPPIQPIKQNTSFTKFLQIDDIKLNFYTLQRAFRGKIIITAITEHKEKYIIFTWLEM